ncbi:MAG: YqgE/AlgH family protein [Bacteroidia bacterium]|nr:YqgE/AlgH family protein [Bacteroidia bacterium]
MKSVPEIGSILLADPFLKDEYFSRSVILLADYNDEGAFGFIINRPIDFKIKDAFEKFPDFDSVIYLGGPVQRDFLYYLHTCGELIKESKLVYENLSWGGDFKALQKEIKKGTVKEKDIRFYAGYSGWEAGQLEEEIKSKSWIITRTPVQTLFETPPDMLWKKLLTNMGDEYAEMANYPIDPRLN